MDVIVLAGGAPAADDPLYGATGGRPKAILEIGGRPMAAYTIAALRGSTAVNRIAVIGLSGADRAVVMGSLDAAAVTAWLPDQGGFLENVLAGLRWLRDGGAAWGALAAADIPLLTPSIVDATLSQTTPEQHLVTYHFVTRETIESKFRGAGRTVTHLRDHTVAGGDLHVVQTRLLDADPDLWRDLLAARKQPWRIARRVGLGVLLRLVLRRLTVRGIEQTAERVLGGPCRVVLSPYPELAMDVDKPRQLALVTAALVEGRGGTNSKFAADDTA